MEGFNIKFVGMQYDNRKKYSNVAVSFVTLKEI